MFLESLYLFLMRREVSTYEIKIVLNWGVVFLTHQLKTIFQYGGEHRTSVTFGHINIFFDSDNPDSRIVGKNVLLE